MAGAHAYYSSAVLLHEGKDVGPAGRPRLLLPRQHKTTAIETSYQSIFSSARLRSNAMVRLRSPAGGPPAPGPMRSGFLTAPELRGCVLWTQFFASPRQCSRR